MTAIDVMTGTLEDTLTHFGRSWNWVPGDGIERFGTLTIRQRRKRGRQLVELFTYHVQEEPPLPFVMGRVFLLAKQDDSAEVYEVIVGPNAMCSCTAGRCKQYGCKHRDGMQAVVKALEGK